MSTSTRPDLAVLRERVKEAIARERDHVVEIAETIRQNPEIGYQEFMASQLLADHLKEAGYDVENPMAAWRPPSAPPGAAAGPAPPSQYWPSTTRSRVSATAAVTT